MLFGIFVQIHDVREERLLIDTHFRTQVFKLDRLFAKPFIGSLEHGHRDGVTATATSRNALIPFISGSADGEICIWDITSQSLVRNIPGAHSRSITGLVFANDGRTFYSCADDGLIRSWTIAGSRIEDAAKDWDSIHGPIITYIWITQYRFLQID